MSRPTSPQPAVRSGILVISVWLESGDQPTPRARLTAATWPGDRRSWVAAGVDQICADVRSWLIMLAPTDEDRVGVTHL